MNNVISKAFEKAQALSKASGAEDDISRLPEQVQNFLLVYAAQGVIDNGGYCYFFESDWPQNPPYSKFIDAYSEIGCVSQANELQRIVLTFPFSDPHMKAKERQKFIKENYDEENFKVTVWGDKLCGDEEVWRKLADYYQNHANIFA